MPSAEVEVHLPLKRITADGYAKDDFLLNQLEKVNDTPEEDGMPLRAWVIKSTHDALEKNPKLREVHLKPKAVKPCHTQFIVIIDEE
ncbi:hypothetical protein TRSC58_04882 [Trypanosoma rangeli SC58]|uniref:Uncharacterized protein n=1 Tax=Trypanosoma rangeli SC58 TaxID=429131 RepID=A0A061IWA5_TRYRA|nr:hypothetical protein TRSC58_04882 [Trypanosoma rangeli SC58]